MTLSYTAERTLGAPLIEFPHAPSRGSDPLLPASSPVPRPGDSPRHVGRLPEAPAVAVPERAGGRAGGRDPVELRGGVVDAGVGAAVAGRAGGGGRGHGGGVRGEGAV